MIDKHHCSDFVGLETIKPIAFNPWKHHRVFVCSRITHLRENDDHALKGILSCIGGTLLDFYLGELSPEQIAGEILLQLKLLGVDGVAEYKKWLGLPHNSYKSLLLSDGSRWVLRLGHDSDYFIHIHPGRYSPLTCRCRPTTLKAAIAFRLLFGFKVEKVEIEMINRARGLVGLCPIATVNDVQAFLTFLNALEVK